MQAAVAEAGQITRSQALDDSLARAHQLAVAQGHGAVALEHLLFALQDDPDGLAILESSGVQRDRLAADVSSFLGRLSEATPSERAGTPQPGPDLLRILQLAAMAARQSQRRAIDGAIVLAAIIGDGKSPAAGMLKAQGLTFEAVIKALSQTAAPRPSELSAAPAPASLPAPADSMPADSPAARIARVPDALSADDVLANARARVKKSEPQTLAIKTASATATSPRPAEAVAAKIPPPADAPRPAAVTAQAAPPPTALTAAPVAAPAPAMPSVQPPQRPAAPPAAATVEAPASISPPSPPSPAPALSELRRPNAGAPPPLPPLNGTQRPPASAPAPIVADQPAPQQTRAPAAMPAPPPGPAPANVALQRPAHTPTVSPPPPPPSLNQPMQRASQGGTPQAMPVAPPAMMPPPMSPPALQGPPPVASPAMPPPQLQPHQQPPMQPHLQQQPQRPQVPQQALSPSISLDVVAAAAGLPASMRLGTPMLVEVRIPRDQVDVPRRRGPHALGGGQDTPVYRVVSVRLGTGGISGLAVEPRSPETIWIGMGRDFDAHEFVWQFVVTPTRPGRFAVTLSVSGRTVSPYGVTGDDTPQSETFAVVVKRPVGGRFKGLLVGLTLFSIGAATAVIAGGPIMAFTKTMLMRLLK